MYKYPRCKYVPCYQLKCLKFRERLNFTRKSFEAFLTSTKFSDFPPFIIFEHLEIYDRVNKVFTHRWHLILFALWTVYFQRFSSVISNDEKKEENLK